MVVISAVPEVSASQLHRGRQIVERLIRPDAHVVQRRGNGDLVHGVGIARSKGDAQVRDPVRVMPVRDRVASHGRGMLRQQLIELRDLGEQL